MFERYMERARHVLFFARFEASQLGSTSIEPEHLLLGLIRAGDGLTSRLFAECHVVVLDSVRKAIEARMVSREHVPTSVELPFSPAAQRVLQATADEADRLLHNYIGTEHVLLGLLDEPGSVPEVLLRECGLTAERVRALVKEHATTQVAVDAEPAVTFMSYERRGMPPHVHVVLVQVTVKSDLLPEFEQAILHNARESLAKDPGCLRFDVSQHADDPQRWILHEVYTNPEAHAAHRQSPHFLAYNAVAERAVLEKTVVTGIGRHLV